MLTGTFACECALIFALHATEEAIAVHLAQVKDQGIEPRIYRLNFCLQALERKLDFPLLVENLLNESLAEV